MTAIYNDNSIEYNSPDVSYNGGVTTRLEKTSSLVLGASKEIFVKKSLDNANIQISAQAPGRFIDVTISVSLGLSVEKTKKVSSIKEVSLTLTGSRKQTNEKVLETSLALSGEIGKRIILLREVSLTLSSEEKETSELILEGGLALSGEISKRIKIIKEVSLTLTSDSKKEVILETSLALSGEISKRIEKTKETSLALSGEINKRIEIIKEVSLTLTSDERKDFVFEGDLALGAFLEIKKSAVEDLSTGFVLMSLKTRKHIGKNITIKEHSPSYWHNC